MKLKDIRIHIDESRNQGISDEDLLKEVFEIFKKGELDFGYFELVARYLNYEFKINFYDYSFKRQIQCDILNYCNKVKERDFTRLDVIHDDYTKDNENLTFWDCIVDLPPESENIELLDELEVKDVLEAELEDAEGDEETAVGTITDRFLTGEYSLRCFYFLLSGLGYELEEYFLDFFYEEELRKEIPEYFMLTEQPEKSTMLTFFLKLLPDED